MLEKEKQIKPRVSRGKKLKEKKSVKLKMDKQ